MITITLAEILQNLGVYRLEGESFQGVIDKVRSIDAADEKTIVWVSGKKPDRHELIADTNAKLIICDNNINFSDASCAGKCFIVVDNPKLTYFRLVSSLFSVKPTWGVHSSAIIDPEADIHPNTYIGPFSYVGKARIGEGSVLHGHCHVYDNTEIGKNVVLHANTVVGSDGFGFVWNDEKEIEKMLHLGKTVIEDNVEIYPFSNVDRGTLFETRVMKGAKIDHYSHIGHNTQVGQNSIITAATVMCGGSRIGANTWIGVNTILKEKIEVGDDCLIGLGSIVTKDVPNGETWVGAPARKLKEFIQLQNIFKRLMKDENNE